MQRAACGSLTCVVAAHASWTPPGVGLHDAHMEADNHPGGVAPGSWVVEAARTHACMVLLRCRWFTGWACLTPRTMPVMMTCQGHRG